jgi:hypothetical protein
MREDLLSPGIASPCQEIHVPPSVPLESGNWIIG